MTALQLPRIDTNAMNDIEDPSPIGVTSQTTDRIRTLHSRSISSEIQTAPISTSMHIGSDDDDDSILSASKYNNNGNQSIFIRTNTDKIDSSNSSTTTIPLLVRPYRVGYDRLYEILIVIIALTSWYLISILAIVTTKISIQDWHCPPMVLTIQQLIFGSILLRLVLLLRDGMIQPWPWEMSMISGSSLSSSSSSTTSVITSPTTSSTMDMSLLQTKSMDVLPRDAMIENELFADYMKRQFPWLRHPNFILCGIFNACDFLASNTAFSLSSAHFVETIKASEPITTTAIALVWKVDKLSIMEACSLWMLICGVILSTWGNSTDDNTHSIANDNKLFESIQTASLALLANINFGFRAINQKKYRSTTHESQQLDDVNFLCRMMQVGAIFLSIPTIFFYSHTFGEAIHATSDNQFTYLGLAMINSVSYVTYNLASCYVLSKVTVLQHSSLNCLRRMVAILATSLYFHKAFNLEAIVGLLTSFLAFSTFTYFRNQRVQSLKVFIRACFVTIFLFGDVFLSFKGTRHHSITDTYYPVLHQEELVSTLELLDFYGFEFIEFALLQNTRTREKVGAIVLRRHN